MCLKFLMFLMTRHPRELLLRSETFMLYDTTFLFTPDRITQAANFYDVIMRRDGEELF